MTTKVEPIETVSNCCGAKLEVIRHSGDEGNGVYICGKCHIYCSPKTPTETNEAPVKVPHLLPNKTLEGNYTPTEPTVETKEPSEDGSLVKVREVQPNYTPWDSLNYDQRHDFATSHGLPTTGKWQPRAEIEYLKVKPTVEKWEEVKQELLDLVDQYFPKIKPNGKNPGRGEAAVIVGIAMARFKELEASSVQEAKAEERERTIKFIRSLADLTVNGESKYWTEKAFEKYFEDRGYKFGPERFIADLLASLKQEEGI